MEFPQSATLPSLGLSNKAAGALWVVVAGVGVAWVVFHSYGMQYKQHLLDVTLKILEVKVLLVVRLFCCCCWLLY